MHYGPQLKDACMHIYMREKVAIYNKAGEIEHGDGVRT